ncbi:AcrR family transcriptional regulator [Microvirga flocculans]|uniref:AcrR family transcriptional regulator n=1 Tax=Microvirga flocculans TaxID=217168 RepID=A0A7W6IG99_9HYPH|nr:TetR-like C-terminal domain-containing protein [Microvirga flocculans]MBB4040970.1 AcrR family transcriptional regulator [Microvirga flocculans]
MPRIGLDARAVIDAAAELADAEGLDAVTLASLAKRLRVKPPSLYNHLDGLEGVRRALALRALREIDARITRAAVGLAKDEALIAIAAAFRTFAREHPGLYTASLRAPDRGDDELAAAGNEIVAVVASVLAGYGLGNEDALHATRGLRAIIHGFASLEAAGAFGLPLDLDESFRRLLRAFIAGLQPRDG